MKERRSHRRVRFVRKVRLARQAGRGEPLKLHAEDISLAGMRLHSERPFQVGEVLLLQFDIGTGGRSRVLDLSARVQHVALEREGYQLGVGFLDIT